MPRSANFFWGSATSAHQVEGGNKNDFSEGGLDAGRACNHYNLFEKDFDIAKSLNQNAHRFSIEWSRIEPEDGKFNQKELEHYREVVRALKKRGLEPFVTLWHFTNPIWFAKLGGWENKKAAFYFSRFAEHIVRELKNDVRFWIVLNEPEIYVNMCYVRGKWPPYRRNPIAAYSNVLKNIRMSYLAAYDAVKEIHPEGQFGIATNLIGGSWLSRKIFNFFNHRTLAKIKDKLDFIGLNYYLHVPARRGAKVSDMGWEIYPEGIHQAIKSLKKYNLPIYITENGVADASDRYRAGYIRDHISWMKKAIDDDADVRGYFYWSLLDNFEWHHGFKPRFGLVEVDYGTMERKIRKSAYEYAKIISNFQ